MVLLLSVHSCAPVRRHAQGGPYPFCAFTYLSFVNFFILQHPKWNWRSSAMLRPRSSLWMRLCDATSTLIPHVFEAKNRESVRQRKAGGIEEKRTTERERQISRRAMHYAILDWAAYTNGNGLWLTLPYQLCEYARPDVKIDCRRSEYNTVLSPVPGSLRYANEFRRGVGWVCRSWRIVGIECVSTHRLDHTHAILNWK